MTLREIGDHFDLSTERIRSLEAKALRKLRHHTKHEAVIEAAGIYAESLNNPDPRKNPWD